VELDVFLTILAMIVSRNPGSIHCRDEHQALPLHIASRSQAHFEVIQFVTSDFAARSVDDTGSLPIHVACGAGVALETLEHLVNHGGIDTLHARNDDGALPLHLLCKAKPSLAGVQYLLRLFPAALLVRTNEGKLPVQLAAECSASLDVISTLLGAYPGALVH